MEITRVVANGCANIHFHSDATRVAAVVDGGNRRPVNNLIRW